MSNYARGGFIEGPPVMLQMVPESRDPRDPETSGLYKVYADECFINRDRVCVRRDDWHFRAEILPPESREPRWHCPVHDHPTAS